jgi:spoIIIJ-associated protein
MSYSNYTENAKSYLEKILAILDVEATIVDEEIDENTINYRIDCKADDAGILIGRNGQTLEALQFVLRQMCRSAQAEQLPFIIDVLDYRTRRKRSIEDQAKRGAVAVLNADSDKFALAPMTSYERRIVHQYLQEEFPDLASESEGEGIERHIVISYRGLPEGRKTKDDEMDGDEASGELQAEESSIES